MRAPSVGLGLRGKARYEPGSVSGERFDKDFEFWGPIRRDATSVVGWARDRVTQERGLVRRLGPAHRADIDARAALIAESEYLRRIGGGPGLSADPLTLDDGELVLLYDDASGVELSRVTLLLDAAGYGLTPLAAVACLSEVLTGAITVGKQAPPLVDGAFGHGDISTDSVLLGSDGFARLHDARFLVSGEPPEDTRARRLATAPELVAPGHRGSPSGDVFAIGALLATLVLGEAALNAPETLETRVRRAVEALEPPLPAAFVSALLRAVATEPGQRFGHPEVLRAALKLSLDVSLDVWRAACGALAEVADALRTVPRGQTLEPGRLERLVASLGGLGGVVTPRRPEQPRRISVVPRRPSQLPRTRPPSLEPPQPQENVDTGSFPPSTGWAPFASPPLEPERPSQPTEPPARPAVLPSQPTDPPAAGLVDDSAVTLETGEPRASIAARAPSGLPTLPPLSAASTLSDPQSPRRPSSLAPPRSESAPARPSQGPRVLRLEAPPPPEPVSWWVVFVGVAVVATLFSLLALLGSPR